MKKEWLIDTFGNSWYEELKEFLNGETFVKTGNLIATIRKSKVIYPSSNLVFRVFKETPYDKVKVIIIAQDPYHDGSADGLAFSNSLTTRMSPSLRNILIEIDDECPEWMMDINFGRLDKQDLSRWSKQGVFLLNTALTVEAGKPESHIDYWIPFTEEVIKALNKKNEIIWILLGKESQKFIKFMTNKTHTILEAPHPASEVYRRGAGFFGCGIFKKCNEELEARNKQIIQW